MSYNNNRHFKSDKNKKDYSQKTNPFEQNNWITMDNSIAAPKHQTNSYQKPQDSRYQKDQQRTFNKTSSNIINPSSPQQKTNKNSHINSNIIPIGNKSPVQLMQDILKRTRTGTQPQTYYSKESQEVLGELLTNKLKMNTYIKKIENQMVSLDSDTVKNYEILSLLLKQVSNSDVQIKHSTESGMQIKFNRSIIQRQEAEIQRLQKENQQREKQMKLVIEKYQSIIFDFNDVIEKLVHKEENKSKVSKF